MTTIPDDENLQAKVNFIRAFFDDLDNRITFLGDLYTSGRRDEARVLCSCYIDGLASALYWPEERNNFNFVRALKEYGGEEIFPYIHPKMLEDALLKKAANSSKWETISKKISPTLQKARGRFYDEQEVINLLSPLLNNSEIGDVQKELWRGTFAAIIYSQVRIPAVHGFGPSDGITFDKWTFKGQQVPAIEFTMLKNSLKRIADVAKGKSLNSKKWFGHDYE
ncbi:MAG: hypothetical protein MUP62_04040 [Dehalococcoidia bacterium]|nr:hypothetical protein [Dehalococcoidia bacterium]